MSKQLKKNWKMPWSHLWDWDLRQVNRWIDEMYKQRSNRHKESHSETYVCISVFCREGIALILEDVSSISN